MTCSCSLSFSRLGKSFASEYYLELQLLLAVIILMRVTAHSFPASGSSILNASLKAHQIVVSLFDFTILLHRIGTSPLKVLQLELFQKRIPDWSALFIGKSVCWNLPHYLLLSPIPYLLIAFRNRTPAWMNTDYSFTESQHSFRWK